VTQFVKLSHYLDLQKLEMPMEFLLVLVFGISTMFSRRFLLLRRYFFSLLAIFAISVCCSAATSVDGSSAIPSFVQIGEPLGSGWAIGDLDGDRKIDIAQSREIDRSGSGHFYGVELRLSHDGQSGSFTFSSPDGLGVSVAAMDVDGDHDLDLVISGRLLGQRIGVWINDGNGEFTQDLHGLYSATEGQSLESFRIDTPDQAEGSTFRYLSGHLPFATFLLAALRITKPDMCATVHYFAFLRRGQKHLRAPPSLSSI